MSNMNRVIVTRQVWAVLRGSLPREEALRNATGLFDHDLPSLILRGQLLEKSRIVTRPFTIHEVHASIRGRPLQHLDHMCALAITQSHERARRTHDSVQWCVRSRARCPLAQIGEIAVNAIGEAGRLG